MVGPDCDCEEMWSAIYLALSALLLAGAAATALATRGKQVEKAAALARAALKPDGLRDFDRLMARPLRNLGKEIDKLPPVTSNLDDVKELLDRLLLGKDKPIVIIDKTAP